MGRAMGARRGSECFGSEPSGRESKRREASEKSGGGVGSGGGVMCICAMFFLGLQERKEKGGGVR